MHGSRWRALETEHPVMVTAVKRPAGETRGKWLRDLTPGKCHRASSRPYSDFQVTIWSENQNLVRKSDLSRACLLEPMAVCAVGFLAFRAAG